MKNKENEVTVKMEISLQPKYNSNVENIPRHH